MKKVILTILCLFLSAASFAQDAKQDDHLVGIAGKLSAMHQSQDDISFYTWSLYITLDMPDGWEVYEDSAGVRIDLNSLKAGCTDLDMKKLSFNKNGFYTPELIATFLGGAAIGNNVIVFVKRSWLDEFFRGEKCMIRMESLKKVN